MKHRAKPRHEATKSVCCRIGLRPDVSPDHFRRHGFHVLDRLIGIHWSAAAGAGHRVFRSSVVYSPATEEFASCF